MKKSTNVSQKIGEISHNYPHTIILVNKNQRGVPLPHAVNNINKNMKLYPIHKPIGGM